VQVRDNGVLKVSRAVTSTSSITLNADANVQNTFDILSTPQGIATTIQFSKPSGYSTATESVNVGNGSSVQGILGNLDVQGVIDFTTLTVDDSADKGTRSATLSGSSITELARGTISYSGVNVVTVQGSSGQHNSYKITGSPGTLTLDDHSASDTVSVSSTSNGVVVNGMAGDTASLVGPSSGTNVFFASPDYAILQLYYPSNDVDSVRVNGFSKVTAYSHSASDYAVLYGVSGTSNFTVAPPVASLIGSGYDNAADGFNQVSAYFEAPTTTITFDEAIFWSPTTGAHAVYGAIFTEYEALDQEYDAYGKVVQDLLGLPTSDEMNVPGVPGARMNTFQGGAIYWSPATGAHVVYGGIWAKYNSVGGPASYGLPTSDEMWLPDGQGDSNYRVSYFQDGRAIVWSAAYGAHLIYGAIGAEYAALVNERDVSGYPLLSVLGAPTSDEMDVPGVPGARMNTFQGGAIYWSPATGAHVVYGSIYALYQSMGGPTSYLGLPIGDEQGFGVQYFQGGYLGL
jgi:hypothetical protein